MNYKEWSDEVIFAGQRKERGYDHYAMPTGVIFWADQEIASLHTRLSELEQENATLREAVKWACKAFRKLDVEDSFYEAELRRRAGVKE